jgi:uncharacterized protein involved in tolerance to divalent cations
MTAIAVVTTVGSKKEARRMAHALVGAKLAACAQISKIDSVYAWKGRIESGKEYRVLAKTVEAATRPSSGRSATCIPTSCRRSTPSLSSTYRRLTPTGSRPASVS